MNRKSLKIFYKGKLLCKKKILIIYFFYIYLFNFLNEFLSNLYYLGMGIKHFYA